MIYTRIMGVLLVGTESPSEHDYKVVLNGLVVVAEPKIAVGFAMALSRFKLEAMKTRWLSG